MIGILASGLRYKPILLFMVIITLICLSIKGIEKLLLMAGLGTVIYQELTRKLIDKGCSLLCNRIVTYPDKSDPYPLDPIYYVNPFNFWEGNYIIHFDEKLLALCLLLWLVVFWFIDIYLFIRRGSQGRY